jgi:hypothetical protein
MAQAHPPLPRHHEHNSHNGNGKLHEQNGKLPPLRREIEETDVHALMEENAQLRKLVIQLSKLVIRNVMDH